MKFKKEKKQEIIKEIIKKIDEKVPFYEPIMEKYNISRQTIRNYLKELVEKDILIEEGTRNKKYTLKDHKIVFTLELGNLEEDIVYDEKIRPYIEDCSKNIKDIVEYAFTEMLNNAIDHSQGEHVTIGLIVNCSTIFFMIGDDGVGIFRNIKNKKGLENEREAVFALTKGKLTTDKDNHTGEGIFFSSRVSDAFSIESFGDVFTGINGKDKFEHIDEKEISTFSTAVCFLVYKETNRNLIDVFNQYTDEDYGFSKTHVVIKLFKELEKSLISRSQAKRFLSGLDKFKEITFDYDGIDIIGQGFADQIYRVFYKENPGIILHDINTNKEIDFMIQRAIANR